MVPKPFSIQALAKESQLDLDEVLVRLWDAGITHVLEPSDVVPSTSVKLARQSLGLGRELVTEKHWRKVFGMRDQEFALVLRDLGIRTTSDRKRLPKGAASKLRREAQKRGFLSLDVTAEKGEASTPKSEYFELHLIGQPCDLFHIETADVLTIHNALVADFEKSNDPIVPSGVKCQSLLESAIGRPQTCHGTEYKYPTMELAGAALLHSLTQNHAFHNGNKRTALVALLVFLERHGSIPTCEESELFRLVLQVAQHSLPNTKFSNRADAEVCRIAEWLARNTRAVNKTERPLQWRKLKQVLSSFGCELDLAPSVGNRMNISRVVERSMLWGLHKTRKTLRLQVFCPNDGRDAQKTTIAAIRKGLELDESHGVDSLTFYDKAPWSAGDFIVEYRKTLRRLGKM